MSSLLDAMSAMEGMLDPEMTATKLLTIVRENVENNVKTVDQAAALENRLSEEAAKFNDCLTTIMNAQNKFTRGEISKEDMLAECAPCVDMLKNKCEALQLANVNVSDGDITEDEIATLREYIVGCKDIVASHREMLQQCPTCATEGLMSSLADMEIADEATASINTYKKVEELRKSTDAKTAKQLYSQARRMYGLGAKEKAKKYLAQSKKLYEKLLAKAKQLGKFRKVDRTTKVSMGINSISDFEKGKEVTDLPRAAVIVAYFEDRIDACDALLMQWENKAGKQTFAETKKALKLERTKTRRGNAARRSAEKVVRKTMKEYKPEPETAEEAANLQALYDIVSACESMLDEMDLEYAVAIEAEGGDPSEAPAEDANITKLKELAVELKKAQNAGDEAAAKKIQSQMDRLLNVIQKEAEDAYTQEDMDKARRKVIKTAAIVGGVVAAVGAGTYAGIKTNAFVNVANGIKNGAQKLREKKNASASEGKSLMNMVKSAFGKIKNIKFGKDKAKVSKDGKTVTVPDSDVTVVDKEGNESFIDAMESYMDDLELELAMEAAMEAEGEDDSESSSSPSGIAAKIRAAFAKLRKAKKEDDSSAENEAIREVKEASDELEDAADEADTPEKKKKLSKAVKIGLSAAAVTAVTVGGIVLGKKLRNKAQSKSDDVSPAAIKAIPQAAQAIAALPAPKKTSQQKISGRKQPLALPQGRDIIYQGSGSGNSKYGSTSNSKSSLKGSGFSKAEKRGVRNSGGEAEIYSKNSKLPISINRKRNIIKNTKQTEACGESFLSDLAFSMESVLDDEYDYDYVYESDLLDDEDCDPTEGKAFDDDDMIDDAIESDMDDLATEAMIDLMLAEDGIEDPED